MVVSMISAKSHRSAKPVKANKNNRNNPATVRTLSVFKAKFSDDSSLAKEAELIVKNIGNVNKRIQDYLVSEIVHCETNRDYRRINRLINSLAKGSIKTGLIVKFIGKYADCIVLDKDQIKAVQEETDNDISKYPLKCSDKRRSATIGNAKHVEASQEMWWTVKTASETKDWVLTDKLDALIKQANEKANSKNAKVREASEIDQAMLQELREVLAKYAINKAA